MHGNERADHLAEESRLSHSAYSIEWVREVRQQQAATFQALGVQEMDSRRERQPEIEGGECVSGTIKRWVQYALHLSRSRFRSSKFVGVTRQRGAHQQ